MRGPEFKSNGFLKDLNYLDEEKFQQLTNNINEIKAMLISLIGKIRNDLKT
jgi:four helix bundle protein